MDNASIITCKALFRHQILIAGLLLASSFSVIGQTKQNYRIEGRIEANSAPSTGKSLVVTELVKVKACTECWESFSHFTRVDSDGKFSMGIKNGEPGDTIRVWLIGVDHEDSAFAVFPPFEDFVFVPERYLGIEFKLGRSRTIRIGSRPVSFRYSKLTFHFSGSRGKQLLSSKTMWMRIRDSVGNLVAEPSLSDRMFLPSNVGVSFFIPDGNWILEFAGRKNSDAIAKPVKIDTLKSSSTAAIEIFTD